MSDQALTILLTSIGAILVATVGAVIGAAVNSRAKIDEGLREQRLQVYPQLWAHTSIVSRWPRTAREAPMQLWPDGPGRRDLPGRRRVYLQWTPHVPGRRSWA